MNQHLNVSAYMDIINRITDEIYEAYPALIDKYGERGRQKCIEDNEHHFRHLETAYALQSVQVFTDYAVWLNGILQKHGMTAALLVDNFERIARLIQGQLAADKEACFQQYLQASIRAIS